MLDSTVELLDVELLGFPRPFSDETFTSWVFRCATNKSIKKFNLDDLVVSSDYNFLTKRMVYEDPDFDFNSDFIKSATEQAGLSLKIISRIFKGSDEWVLPWSQRKYYCPVCLNDDVADNRLPYWRKHWCYVMVTHCSLHKIKLEKLEHQPSVRKSWDAFVKNSTTGDIDFDWNFGSSKWFKFNCCRVRFLLATKVRQWYLDLPSKYVDNPEIHYWRRRCFKIFFHLFLQLRTMSNAQGIARSLNPAARQSIDHDFNGYPNAYELGVLESDSTQRMCALILCGLLFSVFSNAEVSLIQRLHKENYLNFQIEWEKSGWYSLITLNYSNYFYLRCKFSGVPLDALYGVRHIINEIEKRYREGQYDYINRWDPSCCWRRWHFDPAHEPLKDPF